MILLLSLLYSGLSGLWLLVVLVVLINSYIFRTQATTLHFFLLFSSFLKLLNCIFLSLALFYQHTFFKISACSTFTIHSTFQITLFLLISKGYCISHNFSMKENLFVIFEMNLCFICYTVYLMHDFGSAILLLFIIQVFIVIMKQSEKTLMDLVSYRQNMVERDVAIGIRSLDNYILKVKSIRVSFWFFLSEISIIYIFDTFDFSTSWLWVVFLMLTELISLACCSIFSVVFQLQNREPLSIALLNDLNFLNEPRLLEVDVNVSEPGENDAPVIVLSPANQEIFIGERITRPRIFI